jgi:hypothetical protein
MNGGQNVLDLASEIESELGRDTELREKFWANLMNDLGTDYESSLDRRFDISYAERNLVVFAMHDIATLYPIADERISSVRYVVELTAMEGNAISSSDLLERVWRTQDRIFRRWCQDESDEH